MEKKAKGRERTRRGRERKGMGGRGEKGKVMEWDGMGWGKGKVTEEGMGE